MFYAHIILAKKGPLARIWLAAHWDKKITKAHVFETNIEKSVEGIMQPKVKLALRTSGHLLLGVVRIYSRKAKYLLADCNEAFVKIKMAFRPGIVDLPEGHKEANVNAITLPEVFHDFDTALPELSDIDLEAQFSINQSRADEITMREDYGSLSLSLQDEGFGDVGFEGDTPDLIRGTLVSNVNDQVFENEGDDTNNQRMNVNLEDFCSAKERIENENFGDDFDQPELFEDDLFVDTHVDKTIDKPDSLQLSPNAPFDCNLNRFEPGGNLSPASSCQSFPNQVETNEDVAENFENDKENADQNMTNMPFGQSTLLQNEEESFALAPIDATAYRGITKNKRKRKLIVDEIKNISGEEMKAQLANTSDIVTTLDLAPPTKRLMYWKETGGVEKLFALPSRDISARALFSNYQRHLVSRVTNLDDFSCLGPNDILALDQIQVEREFSLLSQKKGGRKRKQDGQIVLLPRDETVDIAQQSLPVADQIRENNGSLVSQASLDIPSASLDNTKQAMTMFDNIRSPGPMFSMTDLQGIDQMTSLNDIPFTPGNLQYGVEDDFNNGNLTPAELHHGRLTPPNTTLENRLPIPNLQGDQLSQILSTTSDMTQNLDACGIANVNTNPESALASDWNDYDVPMSISLQNVSEQQMENETDEQFEERVLNKRAAQLFYAIKARIIKQDSLCLSQLTNQNSRKQAAQKFYSLLVLKKFRALDITQMKPYGEIEIYRGPMFDNPKL